MKETEQTQNTQPKPRLPYTPPQIQSEPLFESNALESAGKSGDNCLDPFHPCAEAGCSGS